MNPFHITAIILFVVAPAYGFAASFGAGEILIFAAGVAGGFWAMLRFIDWVADADRRITDLLDKES